MQSYEAESGQRREEATRIVNEVWESCWNDTRPFDEVGEDICAVHTKQAKQGRILMLVKLRPDLLNIHQCQHNMADQATSFLDADASSPEYVKYSELRWSGLSLAGRT